MAEHGKNEGQLAGETEQSHSSDAYITQGLKQLVSEYNATNGTVVDVQTSAVRVQTNVVPAGGEIISGAIGVARQSLTELAYNSSLRGLKVLDRRIQHLHKKAA